jgi:5-methylcytosine-specific restriction endonuclease McrA
MLTTKRDIKNIFSVGDVVNTGGNETSFEIVEMLDETIRIKPTQGKNTRSLRYNELSLVIDNFKHCQPREMTSFVTGVLNDNNVFRSNVGRCYLYGMARKYLSRKESSLLSSINTTPTADRDELEKRVAALLNAPNLEEPEGVKKPERRQQTLSVYKRDPKVVAWIIKNANGKCECCGDDGFIKNDGSVFLEVHHLRLLAENGSDTPQNAVALCANCHRKLHYAKNKEKMRKDLIEKIERLQKE